VGLVLRELGLDLAVELLTHCELVFLELLAEGLQFVAFGLQQPAQPVDLLPRRLQPQFQVAAPPLALQPEVVCEGLPFLHPPPQLLVLPLESGGALGIVALIIAHLSLEVLVLVGERLELDGLLGGLVDLETQDVVQTLDLLNGVVELALRLSIPAVELADGLLVSAVLLLDLELVGVAELRLQLPVPLPPRLQLVGLVAREYFQLEDLLLLAFQGNGQPFQLLACQGHPVLQVLRPSFSIAQFCHPLLQLLVLTHQVVQALVVGGEGLPDLALVVLDGDLQTAVLLALQLVGVAQLLELGVEVLQPQL
jgi:hypothetical protein